jgi:hypothetical protein
MISASSAVKDKKQPLVVLSVALALRIGFSRIPLLASSEASS